MKLESIKKVFDLAVQNHKKNNFKIAEKFYKEILYIDHNHLGSNFLLGTLYAQTKNLDLAKQLLQKTIVIDPNYTEAHYNLGNVLIELKKIKEAINCFKKAIQVNPNYTDAHNNLGNLLKESGEVQEAINCYEKAIQIDPNYATAYNNLGTIFQKSGDYQKAISSFEKSIQLQPNLSSAHNNLGLIFHKLGDHQKAIKSFEKAIQIKPDYGDAHGSLGKVFKALGEFKNAINCYEKATRYKSEDLIFFYYLSQLKEEILDSDLKSKTVTIMNDDNCTKINFAYGNFLLSIYELQEENYEKEFNYLLKGHLYYFESKKNNFKSKVKPWLNIAPEIKQLVNLNKSNINIKKDNYEIKPIFIVGVPRSGSTLVEKVIASGTRYIPIGEETHILHEVVDDLINNKKSIISDIEIIKTIVFEKYKQKGLIQERSDCTFTDKSLENFFYIGLIKKIFPNAKVINCKRNVLSSIMSIIKNNLVEVPWAHNLEHIFEYFNIYHHMIENFKKTFPDFIYELQYEKFVNDSEIESKELLKFCDLPWDKKCLEFYKRKELISKTASNIQIRKAIYKDSAKKYLPYKQFLDKYGNKYSWFK